MDAVANYDRSIKAEVAPNPRNSFKYYERTKQDAVETERTDLKETEAVQTPKQQVVQMETGRTCVRFGRVGHVHPSMEESAQVHSEQAY